MPKQQKNYRFDEKTISQLDELKEYWSEELRETAEELGIKNFQMSETTILEKLIQDAYNKMKYETKQTN